MSIQTELFTVTKLDNSLVSLPMIHVVGMGEGRYTGRGSVTTSAGGSFDTQENYQELVEKWQELTKTVLRSELRRSHI